MTARRPPAPPAPPPIPPTPPPIPPESVRIEDHPGHAARLVAIYIDGAWRVWVINFDRDGAARVADELAAVLRSGASRVHEEGGSDVR